MWVAMKEHEFFGQLYVALTAHSDIKGYLRMRANTSESCIDLGSHENLAPWFKAVSILM